MKRLLVILAFSALSLFSQSAFAQFGSQIRITEKDIHFTLQDFEGTTYISCTHKILNELSQDWDVKCDGFEYYVHLWLTRYERSSEPKTTYELLYWVTEVIQGTSPYPSSGSTTWFNMKNSSDIDSIMTRQSVQGDTAGLYLQLF